MQQKEFWRWSRDRDRMRLLKGKGRKGLKTSRRLGEREVLRKKAEEGVEEWGIKGMCVFPGVSRLSCRVVHHCVPGDCVCGLAPL